MYVTILVSCIAIIIIHSTQIFFHGILICWGGDGGGFRVRSTILSRVMLDLYLARIMTVDLVMLALILLILAHGVLIRSCYALHTEIPKQSEDVSSRLDNVSSLLDEALDMLADAGSAVTQSVANASPFESPPQSILSTLITSMLMRQNHASTTQQEQREIHEVDPSTTNAQDDQRGEHSAEPFGLERNHEGVL